MTRLRKQVARYENIIIKPMRNGGMEYINMFNGGFGGGCCWWIIIIILILCCCCGGGEFGGCGCDRGGCC